MLSLVESMSVEELRDHGLEVMGEDERQAFLDEQDVGVLGLPAPDGPYLLPMSYAVEGSSLYVTYWQGSSSRKTELTERAEVASFLVYSVETMFDWRSVALSGTMTAVPETHWGDLEAVLEDTWRPDLLRNSSISGRPRIYRFDVVEAMGIKHTGLAAGSE